MDPTLQGVHNPKDPKDKMNPKIGAIYHILLSFQYGIWTINLTRVIYAFRKIMIMHVRGLHLPRRLEPSV